MKALIIACVIVGATSGATMLHAETPPVGAASAICPQKLPTGAGIVSMQLKFSSSNPEQDLDCAYADGSTKSGRLRLGCDLQPVDVFADGGGSGPRFGFHECRETAPGGGRCRVICP